MGPKSPVYEYLRYKKKFPTVWCPGCGIGTVMGAIIRAVMSLGYEKNDVVMVSGIGCSSRMPVYVDFNTLHTTHGRAIAFATGIKLVKPHLKVIVVTGDGDGLAIGGNHFIHAARRNIDLTHILINNSIYGMTGGQYSPTTPVGAFAYTAPYGNIEPDFDVVKLGIAAGASFVARTTVYHVVQMGKIIEKALKHKGYSLVDVISQCPVLYGRLNKMKSPVEMLRWQKEHTVDVRVAAKRSPEELKGKYIVGIFKDEPDMPEYVTEYQKLIDSLKEGATKR